MLYFIVSSLISSFFLPFVWEDPTQKLLLLLLRVGLLKVFEILEALKD